MTACADELRRETLEIIEGYSKHIRTGMPFITAKFAMSLDGKIATRIRASSQWITGGMARQRAHGMRAMSEAVDGRRRNSVEGQS